MEGAVRRLVVMRHAQAEATGPTDRQRLLTRVGQRQARETGAWLAGQELTPEAAIVSDAERTRETWSALAAAAGWTRPPQLCPQLYSAGVDAALDLVRYADPDARTLLLLGHNPTVGSLVALLDDGRSSLGDVISFPTSACAVLEWSGAWPDLAFGEARLVAFHAAYDG